MQDRTASFVVAEVLTVDGVLAEVRDQTGRHLAVRRDLMRAQALMPDVGEQWVIEQSFGSEWSFAMLINSPMPGKLQAKLAELEGITGEQGDQIADLLASVQANSTAIGLHAGRLDALEQVVDLMRVKTAWRNMFQSIGQSVPNDTITPITNWADESNAPTTTTSEIDYSLGIFTVAREGVYQATLSLIWSVGSGTTGRFVARLEPSVGNHRQDSRHKSSSVPEFMNPKVTAQFYLPVNGTVRLCAYQGSGGSLSIVSGAATGATANFASIRYIAPVA